MNENNGFILKPEMYNQEEWCKMFMKSIETINNLQFKIDRANELLQLLHYKFKDEDSIHNEIEDIQKVLKEVNCDEVK